MARAKSQILSKEDLKTAKAEAKAALKEAQATAKAAAGARKTLDKSTTPPSGFGQEVVVAEKAVAKAQADLDALTPQT